MADTQKDALFTLNSYYFIWKALLLERIKNVCNSDTLSLLIRNDRVYEMWTMAVDIMKFVPHFISFGA